MTRSAESVAQKAILKAKSAGYVITYAITDVAAEIREDNCETFHRVRGLVIIRIHTFTIRGGRKSTYSCQPVTGDSNYSKTLRCAVL